MEAAMKFSRSIQIAAWAFATALPCLLGSGGVRAAIAPLGDITPIYNGADDPWDVGGDLTVGDTGAGELIIDGGSRVNSSVGRLGGGPSAVGMATVTGTGSTWINSDSLGIGGSPDGTDPNGDGVVNIRDGGMVASFFTIHIDPGSAINIKSGGMLAKRAPPKEYTLTDFLIRIDGSDAINYWNGSEWSDITNATLGVDYAFDYRAINGQGYAVLIVGSRFEGDLDGDNDVDGDDFLTWQRGDLLSLSSPLDLGAWEANYGADYLPLDGDFDSDSDVDGDDFLAWQRGESPSSLSQFDLMTWETSYGAVAPVVAISPVPEPTTLGLVLAVICRLAARRRRSP